MVVYLFAAFVCSCMAKTFVSPFQYGWKEAKSDKERYRVLYKTHTEAVRIGTYVDYSGIDTADIELYDGCKLIPLTTYNDFKGVVINVKNNIRQEVLFRYIEPVKQIDISKEAIDKGIFRNYSELQNGDYLLFVQDANDWGVREGSEEKITRKDIIYIKDGYGKSKTIMPYNNDWSAPVCNYTPVRKETFVLKNLTVNRIANSTYITLPIEVQNLYDVLFDSITVNTPDDNNLYGDFAVRITNCMKVEMNHIAINGSYSQKALFGYGLALNNIADFKAKNIYGHAKWGIFGNYNVNGALLEYCDINRWDTHAYAKDITLRHCKISNVYNQFSSVYGTVTYDNCHFINCIPHLIDSSFNAYTEYNVVFSNCTIDNKSKNARMFQFYRDDSKINQRHELTKKYWPNVTIKNTKINFTGQNPMSLTVRKLKFNNDKRIDNTILNMLSE